MLLLPLALLTRPWKFCAQIVSYIAAKKVTTNDHLGQDILVEMSLKSTHFHAQNAFALCRQRLQYITLETTQHERLELLMQPFDLLLVIRVGEIKLVR